MPLAFREVYLVTSPPGDLRGSYFAVGVRGLDPQSNPNAAGKKQAGWQWIPVASFEARAEPVSARGVVLRDGDLFEIQTFDAPARLKRSPVVVRFERLSHKLWSALGEKGWLGGYDAWKKRLTDDAAVHNYFVHAYLPDWWEEKPEI